MVLHAEIQRKPSLAPQTKLAVVFGGSDTR